MSLSSTHPSRSATEAGSAAKGLVWLGDPLTDLQLLRQVHAVFGWAYADLYLVPPVQGDGWTSGNVLRPEITEAMVAARGQRAGALIREHGRKKKWSIARIEEAVKYTTAVWLDSWDCRLPSLGYSDDWPDRLMGGKRNNDDNWE
ncbi:hypothetical protein J2X36_002725 [Methylobacterium sp. BE186]|uniref:hypothetical protein n=1 Tax=Methylobacterium sp. BE186 TaxID=2817715 RepID=UPI00285FC699|nr:hypothetical protein [Methylobacterium sp. BE186]MDR7037970.1 hypothetical protein [Methylobacterium sp. BE186]